MKPDDRTEWGSAPRHFQSTRWSLVIAAGQSAACPEDAQAALSELCRIYWYPVYGFIRQRCSQAEAADLTQEFFARLFELGSLKSVEQSQGHFRSWLLQAVKNFLSNARKFARAQKRDCRRTVNFDALDAEERYAAERCDTRDPERVFLRRSTLALLEQVLRDLREQYYRSGRGELFDQLSGFLPSRHELQEPVYEPIAIRLGISKDAVKVAVFRLRQDYGRTFRSWLLTYLHEPNAVQDEIRCMLESLRVSDNDAIE